jgi:predicted component of type VI protein secretion system
LKHEKKDKAFYETMMTFSVKVLSNAFENKEDIPKLEEEVSRLFRSNAFNISTRSQCDEQRKKKYPQLKEAGPNDKIDDLVKRMEHRLKVPKENNR